MAQLTHADYSSSKNSENIDGEDNTKLANVEDALTKLGGYSRLQFIATILISFVEVPAAMMQMSPIILGRSDIEYFCETSDGQVAKLSSKEICNFTCVGNLTTKQEFHSIVREWDLVCDKAWITETFTSVQMVGIGCGSVIVAAISDRFGRKKAFLFIATVLGLSGILCFISPNLYFYAFARFLAGFAISGSFVAHFNYLMEFLTPAWRTICGCLSFWAFGEMALGLVGYFSTTWRTLSWASSVPAFIVFASYFVLPESPRFLLCKNRTKEAAQAFNKIAKINSRPPLDYSEVEYLQKQLLKDEDEKKSNCRQILNAFKNRRVKINLLIFFFAWFANAVVYYGLSYNTKNLEGNIYLNVFYLGLIDFFAELAGMYCNNRYGRRKSFSLSLVLSAVFLLILVLIEIYMENSFPTLILIFSLAGRFFNELSWGVMACFTGETFPTIIRSVCMSICLIANSFGGILAPQMAYLGTISRVAPYIIFCIISIMSAGLSVFLVEMKGKPLQDTATTNIKMKSQISQQQ